MGKVFYALTLLNVLFLFSCEEKQIENTNKQQVQVFKKDSVEEGQCKLTEWKRKRNEVFPFKVCDRIELVTYDSTVNPDLLIDQRIGYNTILTNSLGQSGFSERIRLDSIQSDSLFAIMYNYVSVDSIYIRAACYNPRHAILFYKGNTLVEYFEICFACAGTEYLREQSRFPQFCNEQWCYLQQFFRDSGIKTRLNRRSCE